MSLELALQENTETMKRLIAALEAAGSTCCGQEVVIEHPVGPEMTATEVLQRQTEHAAAAAKKSNAAELAAAGAVAVALAALTYDDIRKPFLRLVQTDRNKAVALLETFGIASLKDVENSPERFLAIATAIEKASA